MFKLRSQQTPIIQCYVRSMGWMCIAERRGCCYSKKLQIHIIIQNLNIHHAIDCLLLPEPRLTTPRRDPMSEIELRGLSVIPPFNITGGIIKLELRRTLVLLFDLDLIMSRSDLEDWEEVDDARRWRCILVGSISAIFARRANRDKTERKLVIQVSILLNGSWTNYRR